MILPITFNKPKISNIMEWTGRIMFNNHTINFLKIQIIFTSLYNKPNLAHFHRIIKPNQDMHTLLTKSLSMQIIYHLMKIFQPTMGISRTFTNQLSKIKVAFKDSWAWIKWVSQKIQNGIHQLIIKSCFNSKMNMFHQILIFPIRLRNIKD